MGSVLTKASGPFLVGVVLGLPLVADLRLDSARPLLWYLLLVQLLVAMVMSARRETGSERLLLTVALASGAMIGIAGLVVRLLVADPWNNMWPLAVVLYGLLTLAALSIGVGLGAATRYLFAAPPTATIRR